MLEEVKKRLNQNLRNLHLPTIRQCYEEQGQLAEKNSSTYEHYLDELVELEVEARRQNRVDRYLRESKLPLEKSWEAFDRKRLPRKVDVQLDTLLEGSFVDRHEKRRVQHPRASRLRSLVMAKERVGYPTQKPIALYERIIKASSLRSR